MCTLIIAWNPNSDCPLLVGANRDENPNRHSEPWAFRESRVLCPIDVRGGTWIGINSSGVFAALTNLDQKSRADRGRHSRGHLVLQSLRCTSVEIAVAEVVKMMMKNIYNAFNLLIADRERMIAVIGYGPSRRMEMRPFDPGLHVATGWGVDNCKAERCKNIKAMIDKLPVGALPMKELLTIHGTDGTGTPKGAVCVHCKDFPHITRSSAIIRVKKDWSAVEVEHVECQPCKAERWNEMRMEL